MADISNFTQWYVDTTKPQQPEGYGEIPVGTGLISDGSGNFYNPTLQRAVDQFGNPVGTSPTGTPTTSGTPTGSAVQQPSAGSTGSGLFGADTKYNSQGYTAERLGDPTQWNVTAKQTAAGQLGMLLDQDSPLMQRARTQGLQQAGQRGLLNSSMAVGAAQDSVIDHATPLATFDADINAKAAGYNAETRNQFARANQEAANRSFEFNANSKNTASQFNAQTLVSRDMAIMQGNIQASLDKINNDAKWDLQSQNIYGGLSQEFNKAILAINTDTNMDQQSKDYAIQQLFDAYKAQISMLSNVGGVPDVSQLLISNTTTATQPTSNNFPSGSPANSYPSTVQLRILKGVMPTKDDFISGYARWDAQKGRLVWIR